MTGVGLPALVCVLLLAGRGRVWLIYPVMFGYGVADGLLTSAQTALIPQLLPAGLLGEANAALQVAGLGLRVVSPLLGAGLLAWAGPVPVIAGDAVTFAVAAAAAVALRLREPEPAPAAGHWRAEASAGFRHIRRTAPLRRLLVTGVIALCVFGFLETIPYAVTGQGLHRPPAFLGALESVMGAGALTGGAVAAGLMRRTGERALVAAALLASVAACLLLMTPWLAAVLTAMLLLGACLVWVNVGATTLIQRRTPPDLVGRVDAALTMAIAVPQAASIALGAALVAVVGYRFLLAVMAVVITAAAGYLMSGRDPAGPAGAGAAATGPAPLAAAGPAATVATRD